MRLKESREILYSLILYMDITTAIAQQAVSHHQREEFVPSASNWFNETGDNNFASFILVFSVQKP